MKKLNTVLVTGAEGFLGRVVATKFLSEGCQVIGTYFKDKPMDFEHPSSKWIQLDASQSVSATRSLAPVLSELDGLIHCAGGFRWAKTDEITDSDLDFLIDANFRSSFNLVREILPTFKNKNFGRIVFVSARATLSPTAGMAAYTATKAAINELTLSLADEVRGLDINVNSVLPTIIDTPANRRDMPKADPSAWVAPEALADIILPSLNPGENRFMVL